MANDPNIKIFTAADIEKYHKGELSARQMHDLEKAALDDPFLADALEGYGVPGVNAGADLAALKKRLEERTGSDKVIAMAPAGKQGFPWLRAAAMIIAIGGAGLLIYQLTLKGNDNAIAERNEKAPASVKTDSAIPGTETLQADSSPVNDVAGYARPVTGIKTPAVNSGATTGNAAEINMTATAPAPQLQEEKKDIAKPIADDKASSARKTDTGAFRMMRQTAGENQQKETVANARADADKNKSRDVSQDREFLAETVIVGYGAQKKQQPNVFRGRVLDNNNKAVPFANITNTADNIGTYSDVKGNFTLTSPDSVLNVQVRSVGFENTNLQLQAAAPDNPVQMQEDRSFYTRVLDTTHRAVSRARSNNVVLEEPEPVDGWNNYDTYIANNLSAPENTRAKQNSGEVTLSFEVNQNGEPTNITVDKSLCASCDKEAIRLIREGPKWKRRNAKNRRTSVTIQF